jgi:hypothetical protein
VVEAAARAAVAADTAAVEDTAAVGIVAGAADIMDGK